MQLLRTYRGWLRLLTVLVLIALVFFFKIDLTQTLALLWRANLFDVTLAVVLFIPFLAVKAWRWQIILRDLKVNIPFGEALKLYALGLGAGMLTPGNVGDAIKVAYLRERGFAQAVVSAVLDRLWDVLILLLLAASGIFLFPQISQDEWLALAFSGIGMSALLVLTIHPRTQAWLFKQLLRLRKNKNASPYQAATFTANQMLVQFGLSVVATVIVYFRLYLLTISIGVMLAPIPFIASMSLASIAALLALAPFGLGTREAALVLIAPVIGISGAQAMAISGLIFFLTFINGVVGLVVWVFQSNTWNEGLKFRVETASSSPKKSVISQRSGDPALPRGPAGSAGSAGRNPKSEI